MTGTIIDFEARAAQARQPAPPLPIETHIVAAALAAEQMRNRLLGVAWFIQNQPRNDATIGELVGQLQTDLDALWRHYWAYHAVLSCEGSA